MCRRQNQRAANKTRKDGLKSYDSYAKLVPTVCHHKLPTTIVTSLILSWVAKMHATCSCSPHHVLHSPCDRSNGSSNSDRNIIMYVVYLVHYRCLEITNLLCRSVGPPSLSAPSDRLMFCQQLENVSPLHSCIATL